MTFEQRPADSAPTRDRERDPAGRARNARPRDGLGRPLPRGAVGVTRVPDDLVLPPHESLVEAQRLLDAGLPFHAHEVLEGTWKASPPAERELWRGLAQLAVGLTHLRRGNVAGGVALLRRASLRLGDYASAPPHGVDVDGLRAWVEQVLATIDAQQARAAGTAESSGAQAGAGVTDAESAAGSFGVPRLQTR